MRPRDNSPLPDDVVRELAAIDAALAGEPVEYELRELAELSMTLRDERPAPSAASPRNSTSARTAASRATPATPGSRPADREAAGSASCPRRSAASSRGASSRPPAWPARCSSRSSCRCRSPGATTAPAATSRRCRPLRRRARRRPSSSGDSAAGAADSAARAAKPGGPAAVQKAAPVAPTTTTAPGSALAPGSSSPALPAPSSGSLETARRSVQRGANLTLATSAGRLDDVASGVLGVTDGVGGIVRSSAIDSRPSGGAASFDLEIPTARLQAALARLSQLASVRSRNESSIDVTEQVTYARNRVVALKAERRALLRRLAAGPGFDETDTPARAAARRRRAPARGLAPALRPAPPDSPQQSSPFRSSPSGARPPPASGRRVMPPTTRCGSFRSRSASRS